MPPGARLGRRLLQRFPRALERALRHRGLVLQRSKGKAACAAS